MASNILSVSIKNEHKEFLDKNTLFSPSELIQDAIEESIRFQKEVNKGIEGMTRHRDSLQKEVFLLQDYLEYIGKSIEYFKWRGENEKIL
jgi:hypothetical protein